MDILTVLRALKFYNSKLSPKIDKQLYFYIEILLTKSSMLFVEFIYYKLIMWKTRTHPNLNDPWPIYLQKVQTVMSLYFEGSHLNHSSTDSSGMVKDTNVPREKPPTFGKQNDKFSHTIICPKRDPNPGSKRCCD